jgi:hypothetical protein
VTKWDRRKKDMPVPIKASINEKRSIKTGYNMLVNKKRISNSNNKQQQQQ